MYPAEKKKEKLVESRSKESPCPIRDSLSTTVPRMG